MRPGLSEFGAGRDLVVIGASAGGIEALKRIVAAFDPDLPAAVCVVVHIAPHAPSALARILNRAGQLPCQEARDFAKLERGVIYVALPDRHLLIEDGHIRLSVAPREKGHRPAVDVLFRSAAAQYGRRVLGVVLCGNRDDGAAGLAAIKARGGAAIVQDPADARYPGMPSNAIAMTAVDAIATTDEIAGAISAMVAVPSGQQSAAAATGSQRDAGQRTAAESLARVRGFGVEQTVETSIELLNDRAVLLQQIAEQFDRRSRSQSARHFRENAESLRRVLDQEADRRLRSRRADVPPHGTSQVQH